MEDNLEKFNQPHNKPKYSDKILHQITHFFEPADGSRQRNTLQIETREPEMSTKGYPKEGTIGIRLIKDGENHAFKLSLSEAAVMAKRLDNEVNRHMDMLRELWEKR